MYYNTTHSSGKDLVDYMAKALSQEERIFKWFMKGGSATPSLLRARLFNNKVPVTSVRRAFTNLTDDGKLVKSELQVEGPYGRPEHVWELRSDV